VVAVHPGAEHEVELAGGHEPRGLGPERVQLLHQPPVLVVDGDGVAQRLVGDLPAGDVLQPLAQLLHLLDVEAAAHPVDVGLGHVEVADVHLGEEQLPDAGEVADDVADGGEEEAVHEVELAGDAQLQRGAGDAADVALVVGVAVDHLHVLAAAQDPQRQHAGRVDELAGHVDRHVGHHPPARRGRLPPAGHGEVEVVEQLLAPGDELRGAALRGGHG